MSRSLRGVQRFAMRLVPPDWRDAVARDLGDELAAGRPLRFVAQVLGIGVRLRAARLRDAWTHGAGVGRTHQTRRLVMTSVTRDVRQAVRAAIRHPGYSWAVVATLAVGIGVNTAIFSMFNWILFRPLPGVARPHELVSVSYQSPRSPVRFWVSYRDYADLRDGMSTFAGLAASDPLTMDVAVGAGAERLDGEVVTTNYFPLLGVAPALGRGFVEAEERAADGVPAAIVSHRLWRRIFNADPAVLGTRISLDGRPFVIVGVAPASFQGRSKVTVTDVWVPIGAYPILQPDSAADLFTNRRQTLFGDAFGRLKHGATVAQAQQEASAVAAGVAEFANRRPGADPASGIGPVLESGVGNVAFTEERLATIFRLLMGAVGLLLLLACANAANLLLARATARRREIAVCQAIGASRFRIVRQQLAEGLVLSLAAAAAGVVLAVWLISLFDGMRIVSSLPAVTGVGLDWRVGVFALAAAIVTALVFATAPALASSRVDLQSSLKDGLTASRGQRRVLRSALVAVQVTVSVLLLMTAGLFLRTLESIRSLDVGLAPEGVVGLSVQPGRYGYSPERSEAYIRELLDRLRTTPGVESAAFTWTTTFSRNRSEQRFTLPSDPEKSLSAASTSVSRQFFQTMRIPVLAGRDFTERELAEESDATGVVIISGRLAEEMFPDGGAVGSRLQLLYPKGKVVEVVGVAGDVRGRALTEDPETFAYTPASNPTWGMIQVRSPLPTEQALALVRDVAREVDPLVLPYNVEPFSASIERAMTEQRLFARLSTLFAATGALLAAIGIYGMMSGAVAERRREFGIRLALGARGVSIVRAVIRTSMLLAVVGVAVGLAGAAALRGLVESRLYGVSSLDPVTVGGTVLVMIALSAVASLLPALRAARVDPVRSLRVE